VAVFTLGDEERIQYFIGSISLPINHSAFYLNRLASDDTTAAMDPGVNSATPVFL
jgi:hypothetical protein